MTSEKVYNEISERVFDSIRITILKRILDNILDALCKVIRRQHIKIENKDNYNIKYLNNTIETVLTKAKHENQELFSEADNSILSKNFNVSKFNSSVKAKTIFCTQIKNKKFRNSRRQPSTDELFESALSFQSVVYFCKNIPNAIEIPKNVLSSYTTENNPILLQNKMNKYHFFIANIPYKKKTYRIIYAEKNKFSRREIISIHLENNPVNKAVLPYELQEQYDLYY